MSKSYENFEDDEKIICPYCNKEYEPSPDETIIGNRWVDCYTEEEYIYTCDCCNKRFYMRGCPQSWEYHTETIWGEATEEEINELQEAETLAKICETQTFQFVDSYIKNFDNHFDTSDMSFKKEIEERKGGTNDKATSKSNT